MKLMKKMISLGLIGVVLFAVGCTKASEKTSVDELTGEVRIDGSSTVFPITEAVAEEFIRVYPKVKIPIGVSGTGGGFKKFIAKETDISNASRSIKDKEMESVKAAGINYIEVPVAFDGLSVIVNKENTWVDSLSVEELALIWGPNSQVKTWQDVRPAWPAEKITFYAPGTDSGTFDYFTDEINGESGAIRTDFIGSEDDNILVQGIAGDKNAIGFFGYAYYAENSDKLKVVPIDGGKGPVEPTFDTIKNGEYAPLSRPLFIYLNEASLENTSVKAFVKFYIENAGVLAKEVGYVALPDADYQASLDKVK